MLFTVVLFGWAGIFGLLGLAYVSSKLKKIKV